MRVASRSRSSLGTVALCLTCALLAGGCGSSDHPQTRSSDQPPATSTTTAAVPAEAETETAKDTQAHGRSRGSAAYNSSGYTQIYRAESASLGRILFDEYGFTLYRFYGDRGSISRCYGACAERWPPYLAVGEFRARKLKVLDHMGSSKRRGGVRQVTYYGHPLYTFTGDPNTGATNGNEVHAFGGQWYALHPNGHKAQGGGSS